MKPNDGEAYLAEMCGNGVYDLKGSRTASFIVMKKLLTYCILTKQNNNNMGGGLMQLVAYGAQDIYLTGNPQITY